MELVYKIAWENERHKAGHCEVITAAWSPTNLFAFTTEREVEGHRRQYVNVLNPNQPWNVFTTQYKGGEITCLQWSGTGTRFLSGDSLGNCHIWSSVNHMINKWTHKSCHSVTLAGEEILAVRWLHPGRRVVFHLEKMEAANLNEKFELSVFRPSAAQCGGKHMDGFVVVTSTGLVHVHCMDSDVEPTFAQAYLDVSSHLQIADVRFTNQGQIFIMTSSGDIHQLIRFHEITLDYDIIARSISININMLQGLPLKCAEEPKCPYTHVSHAKFASHETQDFVLVCVSSASASCFEGWLLAKKEIQVNRLFVQQTSLNKPEVSKAWKFITSSPQLPKVLDFSIPANAMDTSTVNRKISLEKKFFCGQTIAVTLADNTIQILDRLFLASLLTYQLNEVMETNQDTGSKPSICTSIFSTLSCALMSLDENGGLHLFKVPPWLNSADKPPLEATKQTVQLLLYCMSTGKDWWEVLLHINPNSITSVVDLMTSEMKKQSSSLQQSFRCRFLAMKITLYQLSSNAIATDCHLKLLFDAVTLVFRSLFRPPHQVTSEDSDPSLRLQMVCKSSNETDIDQLLQTADAIPQSLHAMQQLIQWVADVALYLLASVPYHNMGRGLSRPCSTLVRDREWLALVRELLVIMRVWGLLTSACSPIFHSLDPRVSVLPHVFRLVSLLWQAASPEYIQKELPSSLVNECCLLPSQVIIPPLEIIPAVNGVLGHARSTSSLFNLQFSQPLCDTAALNSRKQRIPLVSLPGSSGKIDSLRRVFLGRKPTQELKECTRCGILTMFNSLRPSLLKMWDQRFVRSCLCGGMWRKLDPV